MSPPRGSLRALVRIGGPGWVGDCTFLGVFFSLALARSRQSHTRLGPSARSIERRDVLAALHDCHHAQCLELARRLADGAQAKVDLWLPTNAMRRELAAPDGRALASFLAHYDAAYAYGDAGDGNAEIGVRANAAR